MLSSKMYVYGITKNRLEIYFELSYYWLILVYCKNKILSSVQEGEDYDILGQGQGEGWQISLRCRDGSPHFRTQI